MLIVLVLRHMPQVLLDIEVDICITTLMFQLGLIYAHILVCLFLNHMGIGQKNTLVKKCQILPIIKHTCLLENLVYEPVTQVSL